MKCDTCDKETPDEDLIIGWDVQGGSGFTVCSACRKSIDEQMPGETIWREAE